MRLFSFLFIQFSLMLFTQRLSAQREMHWQAGFNLGALGWSPSTIRQINGTESFQRTVSAGFGQVEDVHGRKRLAFLTNTSIGLHAGFVISDKHAKNFTGLRLEFQNNKACYDFNVPFPIYFATDTMGDWIMTDKYLKYSIALHQSIQIAESSSMMGGPRSIYLGASFGQTFYHRNFTDKLVQDHFEDWTYQGTGFTSQTISVSQHGYVLGFELGQRTYSEDLLHSLEFGLTYYAPLTTTYTEEYEFFKQNVPVSKIHVTYGSGTLMFNMRYSFDHLIEKHERDTTKIRHHKWDDMADHKVNGRNVEVQTEISVHSDTMTVWVWDRGHVDGDRISLYLNDKLIAEDILLGKERTSVLLNLVPGANYLVMHALNLGDIPPNTCAMEINDGKKKKKSITVVSDVGKSGAILIDNKRF